MDVDDHRSRHHRSASGLTGVAHFFGILATILMVVWLLHYREGLDLDSDDARRVFNVHDAPFSVLIINHTFLFDFHFSVCAGSPLSHVFWIYFHGW